MKANRSGRWSLIERGKVNPARLEVLARSLTTGAAPFAFCGIAVDRRGEQAFHTAAAPGIAADARSLFRVASLSKLVTGALMPAGLARADVSPRLADGQPGWRFRHPAFPDVPITGAMLAGHTAGLRDDAGYAVPPGAVLADWITAQGDAIWGPHPPGAAFDYSNLGYVVLGTAIDGEEPFDRQASRYLARQGITGGFNWAGVSAAGRARALPTYRRQGDAFLPQIDARVPAEGVIGPDGRALDLRGQKGAANAGVYGPQGGLRTDLAGMLALTRAQAGRDTGAIWTPGTGPMDTLGGLMDQYGAGLQILRSPPFYPRPLIGHFGNAYGFKGGAWWDADTGTAFAYALNGAEMGDESDLLSEAELRIFSEIAVI